MVSIGIFRKRIVGAVLLDRIPMPRPVPATLTDYDVITETLQWKHGDR